MNCRKNAVGRPPDAATGDAVKSAALNLIREKGYAGVSISAIAAAAGVARQTLYNRWNTKADLVLEALFDEAGHATEQTLTDDDAPSSQRLEAFLAEVFTHLNRDSDPLRALIAAAQDDPAFRAAFRERFVLPREKIVTDLLRRAQSRGELAPDNDPEILSVFVHGAFWYRLLNGQPVDAALARSIAAEVFKR